MQWLAYLLEANLYLLIFYGFYRLLLADNTNYNVNRYYLLVAGLLAFILPMLQLGLLKPSITYPIIQGNISAEPLIEQDLSSSVFSLDTSFQFTDYIYITYIFIAICFASYLIIGLAKIIKLWLTAKKHRSGNVTFIELKDQSGAFSFFNLLFIHPQLAEKPAVIEHEMAHIKQKHSLDILFFEIIHVISWFNPVIYFLKRDIKLVHEYIADELTTTNKMQKHEYAMFLIQHSFGITPTPLTNQIFSQSILKRRINMLNKKRTTGWARLRLLLALPLVGLMLCTSTMAFTKDYGYIDLLPEKSNIMLPIQEKPKTKQAIVQKKKTGEENTVRFPPPVVKSQNGTYSYSPNFYKNKTTGKIQASENRYVIINGKGITDNSTFYGVRNATKIQFIKPEEAIKKYGENAELGAIEITGENIKILPKLTPPPPRIDPNFKGPHSKPTVSKNMK